jgi:hypothetical protein
MIEYLNDYISGEKFTEVCDLLLHDESWLTNEDRISKNLNNIFNLKKDNIIIYCRPNFVSYLSQIMRTYNFDKKIILITHNSDYSIDYMDEKIYLQYSQNVNINSDKIYSLPIGLENSYNFPDIKKIEKMRKKILEEKSIKNMVYMNHTIATNISERKPLYDMFGDVEYFTVEWDKNNGIDFESYLDNIYNHKFVISPRGNGIDTHRTWECLYLGTIPIEKRNSNNKYYEGELPICFVNDWAEINQDFLNSEYDRIKNSTWNLDMLKFDYWKKLIKKTTYK